MEKYIIIYRRILLFLVTIISISFIMYEIHQHKDIVVSFTNPVKNEEYVALEDYAIAYMKDSSTQKTLEKKGIIIETTVKNDVVEVNVLNPKRNISLLCLFPIEMEKFELKNFRIGLKVNVSSKIATFKRHSDNLTKVQCVNLIMFTFFSLELGLIICFDYIPLTIIIPVIQYIKKMLKN